MKTLATLAWFAGATALAFAQQRAMPSVSSLSPADEATIRAGSKIYEEAANDRDWPRLLSVFADDIVWMPPNGAAVMCVVSVIDGLVSAVTDGRWRSRPALFAINDG